MPSVPSRRQLSSWLALAALALQLVVSFGHVHLEGIHRGSRPATVAKARAQAEQAPAQQPSDDDGYCAICATIYLAASSSVPQTPQLPALFTSTPIERFDRSTSAFVATGRTPFQSRAPPLI
jgi:hypothetical protein